MITSSPYGIGCIIKPGCLPEPLKPVSTHDPQEYVDICLDCPVKGDCNLKSEKCPLNKNSRRGRMLERDRKVRDLINRGWRNDDAICEELSISRHMLAAAKRRLRERGEVT